LPDQFDVVVLGGGPGGYASALYGAAAGLRVALVEESRVGGTCLHRGCIPAKELLQTAEVLRTVRDAKEFGVQVSGATLDLRASQVRKQEKRLHTETLEELAQDFDDSIEPMVVEIQGTQHRLTGTADAQYDEWRQLLRQIFINESGFVPEEVTMYTEPAPEAPVELPPLPGLAADDGSAFDARQQAADLSAVDLSAIEATQGEGAELPAADEPTTEAAPAADEDATTEAADANASAGDGV